MDLANFFAGEKEWEEHLVMKDVDLFVSFVPGDTTEWLSSSADTCFGA